MERMKAFTLIELLVVISIIALLISLLLPVLGRTKETARRAQCGSNIKNFSAGLIALANDADSKFPPAPHTVSGEIWYWINGETYDDLLYYLPAPKVMVCPNHPWTDVLELSNQDTDGPGTYDNGSNWFLGYGYLGGKSPESWALINEPDYYPWYSPKNLDELPDLPLVVDLIEEPVGSALNNVIPHTSSGFNRDLPVAQGGPADGGSDGGNNGRVDGSVRFVLQQDMMAYSVWGNTPQYRGWWDKLNRPVIYGDSGGRGGSGGGRGGSGGR